MKNGSARRSAITATLVVALLVAQTGQAVAAQIPNPVSSLFLQTSGPNAGINIGDYYTSPAGGNTDHLFTVRVPSDWPPGVPVTIALYDPELAGPSPSSPPARDEIRGGADSATFTLDSPTGSTIATATYSNSSTNGLWVELATFDPGVSGTGTYELHVTSSDNDDNSWRVDASHDPDCAVGGPGNCPTASLQNGNESDTAPGGSGPLGLAVVRTSYQHAGSGLVCQDHVFYVDSSTSRPLRAHNFDMDNNGSVVYTTPMGVDVVGTLSGNGVWNGSSDTTRVGDLLPDINGWWIAKICISSNNQYVFEAPSAGPSFPKPQPTPRLTIAKDDGTSMVSVGDELTYLITATNVSDTDAVPGDAYAVSITDSLPAGAVFLSCSPPSGVTCVESGGSIAIGSGSPLAPGDSLSIDVVVSVGPSVAVTLLNTVSLGYEDSLGNSFPTEQAQDSNSVEFQPILHLDVAGPSQVLRGDSLTATYSLSHDATSDDSPVSAVGFSCDICVSETFLSGDDDVDGFLDDGEIWTFEAIIDTGPGDSDPLIATATVSGSDGNGDGVQARILYEIDLIEPGSIAGVVFEDLDGNGVRDVGEPGLDAASVTLSTTSGPISTLIPSVGDYAFAGLFPGDYEVDVDETALPGGMVATVPDPRSVSLPEGEAVTGIDFGFAFPIVVSGSVFDDRDFDGALSPGEGGVEGVALSLIDQSDAVVSDTTTGADGTYAFTSIPGSYSVRVDGGIPVGWALTTADTVEIGLVLSGDVSGSNEFGVANRPPIASDQTQTVSLGDTPAPLEASDPEGTGVLFDIVTGELPLGIVLESDGTFSGRTSELGIFDLVISACDSAEPAACTQFEFHLTIAEPVDALPLTGIDTGKLVFMGIVLIISGSGLVLRFEREFD